MRYYFRNWGGRFSGRYRERAGLYEETAQWMNDVPELAAYDNPYERGENGYLSPHDKYRLQLYKFNRALYYGDHYNALRYAQMLYRSGALNDDIRLGEIFGQGGVDVLFICSNLFSLTTDTFADLMNVALEAIIPQEEKDQKAREAIKRIAVNSNWGTLFHRSIITGSYKGDVVWTVHGATDPARVWIRGRRVNTWFPVIDPVDRTRFSEHYFYSQFTVDEIEYVARERYLEDRVKFDVVELKKNEFGKKAPAKIHKAIFGESNEWPYPDKMTVDDFVFYVPNKVGDDEDPYGDSDYGRGVLTLADELNHRVTQMGQQLDKHGNLGMMGPDIGGEEVENPSADNRTNRGAGGQYIMLDDKDTPEPKYIVPPTESFTTSIQWINIITEETVRQMRMSPRLLGYKAGAAEEAFDTLRLACVNTLLRNAGRKEYINPSIIRAYQSALRLESIVKVPEAIPEENANIQIIWGDGFPVDPEKRARIWAIRTAQRQFGTVAQAVRDMDGEEGALKTVAAIHKENEEDINSATGGSLLERARKRGLVAAGGGGVPKEPEINAGQEEKGSVQQSR
jgi:hypothetical protein